MRCKAPTFRVRLLAGAVLLLAVLLAAPGAALAIGGTPAAAPPSPSDAHYSAAAGASPPSPAPLLVRAGADAWSETSGPQQRPTITLAANCDTVTLEVLAFEAAFTSTFLRFSNGVETNLGLTNRDVGQTRTITGLPAGELVLGIRVEETGNVFKTGSGSRNSDGVVHARVSGATVYFEDEFGGGDRDFDDAVLRVTPANCVVAERRSPPRPVPPPPPPPEEDEQDIVTDDSGAPPGDSAGGTSGGDGDDGADDGAPEPDSGEGTPPGADDGARAQVDGCGSSVLPVPPPGGWTHGVSDTSSVEALIGAQRFPVASVWVFDVAAQAFLGHHVGRPDSVHRLDASSLTPGRVVIMRRTDAPAAAGEATPAAARDSQRDEPTVLPVPPPGGWTYGVACTSDMEALIAVQRFDVVAVWTLDVAAQAFLGYGVGAPAVVNTLAASALHPDSVVIMSRAAPAPPPGASDDDATDEAIADEVIADDGPAGDDDTTGPIALPNTGSGGLGDPGRSALPLVALAVSLALAGVTMAWRRRA